MSSSNCCFLTHIQVSQETGKVVWSYSHLCKNFPVCCDPQSQGFSIVSEAEVDIFLELPCVLHNPHMLAIWSLVPLPPWNPVCTFGSSRFTCCCGLAWRNLSTTLLACEMCAIVRQFKHLWYCPSLRLERKLTFSSPVATAEFSQFADILSAALSQHYLLDLK